MNLHSSPTVALTAPVLLSRASGVIQIVLDDSAVYWNENAGGFTMRAVKRVMK